MNSNNVLDEFQEVLDNYKHYLGYEENQENPDLPFVTDKRELETTHQYLKDIMQYLNEGHVISSIRSANLSQELVVLGKHGTLSSKSLYSFLDFFSSLQSIRDTIAKKSDYQITQDFLLDIEVFPNIEKVIRRSIEPDYSISSNASENLADIRRRIIKESSTIDKSIKSLTSQYKEYLTSDTLVSKDGLPVLAVKNTYRSRVKGLVSEISNSGETYFIVPLEILEINNHIYALKEAERFEEEKILTDISNMLISVYDSLCKSYKLGLLFDSLLARVNYGYTYRGNVSSIDNYIKLEDLVHPLISKDIVISNTIVMGTDKYQKMMVVTGPNAGGKSVLLKSIALAIHMNQKGFLVATYGQATLPLFDKIVYVGGDDQSLANNLSTFSGHLYNLNRELSKATLKSMILLDELGQGTSPLDGEALALATIDYIENLGAYSVITSHFDRVKDRAIDDHNITPCAMLFDEENIRPTFKVRMGTVGKSYALEVAERLNLIEDIVTKARIYLNKFNDTPEKRTIEELTNSLNEALKIQERLTKKEEELDRLTTKRNNAIESVAKERQSLKEKAQREVDKIIEEKLKEIDEIYNANKPLKSFATVSKIKGDLKAKASSDDSHSSNAKTTFEVGDYVKVKKANANGRITTKSGSSYRVNCDGLSIKCVAEDLEKLTDPNTISIKTRKTHSIDRFMTPKTGVGLECNLIGLRVDEALEKLSKYIDDCLIMNYHQVRIIHGVGTGALRSAVRNYLDSLSHVDSYRFGGEGEGGVGCTVVLLK